MKILKRTLAFIFVSYIIISSSLAFDKTTEPKQLDNLIKEVQKH